MSRAGVRHGRIGPPVFSLPNSRYSAIRTLLANAGGTMTRADLAMKITEHPEMAEQIKNSRGLASLLSNMRHSGEVALQGDLVSLTERALRRLAKRNPSHEE